MCGIAGYIHRESCSSLCQEIELKINHLQECRGPDAINSTYSRMGEFNVHLYHQRLRIQDLSVDADQPMKSNSNSATSIVFNGEIYNIDEIRLKFLPDLVLKTHSDTEVLVESLANNSVTDVLASIRGMFAFGRINTLENELILARDRFGEKPLHFFANQNSMVFASQFDSIVETMKLIGEKIEIDQEAIYKYLVLGYFPHNHSMVRNIKKLAPGGLLRMNFGEKIQLQISVWAGKWHTETKRKMPYSKLESELTESIKLQLIGDVPVGVFLSGGCDSTLVSALAQRLNNNPIHSFSLGFDNSDFDESNFALKAAQQIGTSHHALTMTAIDAKKILPLVLKAYPEPLGDPSVLPTTFISKAAREYVTVVLTGDGADELFLGYGRYARFLDIEKFEKFHSPLVSKILFRLIPLTPRFLRSKLGRLASILDSKEKGHIYGSLVGFPHIEPVLDHDAFKRVRTQTLSQLWDLGISDEPLDKIREIDVHSYLTDDILVKVDRAAMAFGLEARVPFLDNRVVSVAKYADKSWLLSGSQKNVVKQILASYVSKDIFMRKKMGFGAPLGDWFRTELKPWVQQTIEEFDWSAIGIDKAFVQRLQFENLDLNDSNVTYLWMLLVLANSIAALDA